MLLLLALVTQLSFAFCFFPLPTFIHEAMSWHRQRAQAVQNLRKQSLEPKGLRMHDTDICILIEDTVRATGNCLVIAR